MSGEMLYFVDDGVAEWTVALRSDLSAAQEYTIMIQLRSTTPEVKLEPKVETSVNRITSCMEHIEAQLQCDVGHNKIGRRTTECRRNE